MRPAKKEHPAEKHQLHPRSKHRGRYHFQELIASCPELAPFVALNPYGDESINFFDPQAVKTLNKALLKHHYHVDQWDIPAHYLCPPIPGRADYLHYMADVLRDSVPAPLGQAIPTGPTIRCLDVGVGANGIYPLLGTQEYGWSFVGSDIDPVALQAATKILDRNPTLHARITLRHQREPTRIFQGILQKGEYVDFSLCNPPFHASRAEAHAGSVRKLSNLKRKKVRNPTLNFGGQSNELWCAGGEEAFVQKMIRESQRFATSCFWFSTLVAKQAHLKTVYQTLKQVAAADVNTIPMGHGNKISRIVTWTFLTKPEQEDWVRSRWAEALRPPL
ncbi:23S rRNA (adenine1618-N6)-methyltransferase [Catalinimonas alkaloidigena]|uniref:Ribosomal RNA large subunit methyltransferase F n=1 Tax=Catalinimonas alkaloidigena TaxID=1075417 RepID=A0A1G9IWI2_9BACT|nr:23S rRNA (adenine(1618)-N(6))-methyltransferase RlmF [Catalinimonas alkaloidigena]SDL29204.1 23S rRNA (adenine1618-N6)-methyltransferase [Catalinimonas alkaloidigena]